MKKIIPYILTLPLIMILAILITGLINGIIQSLGYIPALGLEEISLDYYKEIIGNPHFRDSLLLSLYTCLLSSVLSVIIGVGICALLTYSGKGEGLFNYILRIPILIPHTVVAFFSVVIFSQSGMISRLMYLMGLIGDPMEFPNLLYNTSGTGIILAYVWKQAPFVAFFVLSLMESIKKTLEEASVNLGASPIKAFFTITLPLSMPSILKASLIITAFSFGAYELPFLLGATKPRALPVQAYIEYTHPDLKHRPYAMAANGIIIIVSMVIAVSYYLIANKKIWGMRESDEK
ncbi:ABC transporter permease [Anaeropeptidivorans aminofermentans]|uniref:ABC transporter permease n=1 Tax=Anaeropeptidivorans aminofermentans TaxID=2934315 RepID=UPI0020252CF9|nr:sugar ABC transporter permease [Anaeropeptidivorans aminofermentans]